jgi:hypothetical protein
LGRGTLQPSFTTGIRNFAASRAARLGDAAWAAIGACAVLVLSAATGANRLVDIAGDNDSVMRLVEVRDLLGGQGWFDMTQYRMGPAGGLEMHWSRLVDAPVAALIWLAEMMTGDASRAEMIAGFLWPGFLLAVYLFLLIRAARALGGPEAAFPAAIIGLAALYFMGIFAPGSFDHHNVQLALILGAVAALLAKPSWPTGLVAGVAAAASLAVGMETAPLVAALGAAVALAFLIRGDAERALATGYGAGFAGGAIVATLATLPSSRWLSITCDAWSGAQAATAIVAGAGLVLAAATPLLAATPRRRLLCLSALAVALGILSASVFPACLADPYAGLDPLLRQYWLGRVTEAQSAQSLIASSPGEAAGYFITPLIGLAALVFFARAEPHRRDALVVALVLAAAFAVSLWQVRGAMFSVPLAIIPLASLIARARAWAARKPGLASTLVLAAAWLVSFNVVWNTGVSRLADAVSGGGNSLARSSPAGGECYRAGDYARLAALPRATVLAVSNLGAAILYSTDHRALSGPYHRNVEGNLAALRALTSAPDAARAIMTEYGIEIVAHCPGNDETHVLASEFPHSLLAGLQRREVLSWLDRKQGEGPLQIFRVRQ